MKKCRSLQNALPLEFRRNGQEHLQIMDIPEIRMQAVGALDDVQLLGCNRNWISQFKTAAVEGTEGKVFTGFQRKQHFLKEPLIIYISADFCEPRPCALFRAEEEIIHMKYVAVIDFRQLVCQSSLASGAVTVDGNDDLFLFRQEQIDSQRMHSQD